ncbi:ATP-binding protein [Cyanobium sp. Lug-B]|uniref:ATP-binding protein n=1 Tax=Cyanobium sp. Lug-B TaxID=2823716 RepID=UPI0020CD0831|nr:ATP-binding protein [Cyanobium sp. Lug-B]MCP9797436.1 ATP-binding protein [Cyanobium sp. Lug-B]
MLEIAKEDIVARLYFDNPWWESDFDGKVQYQDKPRRKYFQSFFAAVCDKTVNRAVVLMGPRRVGKTVMVMHAIRELIDSGIEPNHIIYISLETPVYTGLSLAKLLGLYQNQFNHGRSESLYIFFDEVQYLRDWEVHLKSLVDSYSDYKFTATGSAAAALRLRSVESGAGRFSDYILPPLTFAEYLHFIGRESELIVQKESPRNPETSLDYSPLDINELNAEFIKYMNYGGYPEAVFSESIRENPYQFIKSDIIDKVLLRDLPSLYGISDIQELNKLFNTLAYNSGNEVSLEALSKQSGVAKNTIKRYLEYLEAAFLIKRVERIDQTAKRFKRAVSFKVYLVNPSMRAALFGQIDPESEAMGALTETAVFSQWQHSQQTQLYYARWKSGEVDIVSLGSVDQQPSWAVEVKWSDRPYQVRRELDNCIEFIQRNPGISQPMLITSKTVLDENVLYNGVRFQFAPSSLYAYTLGINLLKSVEGRHKFMRMAISNNQII